MPILRIFCDVRMSADELMALRRSVAPHEVLTRQSLAGSVLEEGEEDPGFQVADIVFGQPNTKSVLQAPHLRWVQVTSAGITRYDTPEFRTEAAARRIVVSNSSDVYAEACAEHVFSFMLAQSRVLPAALQNRSKAGDPAWDHLRSSARTLRGGSVVILGYGFIAKRLVEMLAPFQMAITAYRRRARGDEPVPIVTPQALGEALAIVDHVINILPDNADSRHFVSTERLAQMKSGAIFYNIGRGTTVDQDALLEALRSKKLGAAWLDVTEPEPLPADHPLRAEPNCFITPHIAGGHQNETQTLVAHFLDNLQRFEKGEPLRNRVI
jgi:phosphoglycerate dehydrogenase-like enzyme